MSSSSAAKKILELAAKASELAERPALKVAEWSREISPNNTNRAYEILKSRNNMKLAEEAAETSKATRAKVIADEQVPRFKAPEPSAEKIAELEKVRKVDKALIAQEAREEAERAARTQNVDEKTVAVDDKTKASGFGGAAIKATSGVGDKTKGDSVADKLNALVDKYDSEVKPEDESSYNLNTPRNALLPDILFPFLGESVADEKRFKQDFAENAGFGTSGGVQNIQKLGAEEFMKTVSSKVAKTVDGPSKSIAERILEKIKTPEHAISLKGPERKEYLNALDEVYGDKAKRAGDMGFGDKNYYHGTTADIHEFDNSKLGSFTGAPSAKQGHFFSDKPEVAGTYAAGKNPKGFNIPRLEVVEKEIEQWQSELAKAQKVGESTSDDIFSHLFEGKAPKGSIANIENKINELKKESRRYYDPEAGSNVGSYKLKNENPIVHDYKNSRRDVSMSELLEEGGKEGKSGAEFKNVGDVYGVGAIGQKTDKFSNIAVVYEPQQIRSVNAAFDPRFKDSTKILAGAGMGGAAISMPQQPSQQQQQIKTEAQQSVVNKIADLTDDGLVDNPHVPKFAKDFYNKQTEQLMSTAPQSNYVDKQPVTNPTQVVNWKK